MSKNHLMEYFKNTGTLTPPAPEPDTPWAAKTYGHNPLPLGVDGGTRKIGSHANKRRSSKYEVGRSGNLRKRR